MSFSRMQPTFFIRLNRSANDATQWIRQAVANDSPAMTRSVGNCVEFYVPKSRQRFWSPHLSIQIHDLSPDPVENQSIRVSELVGKFSPRPEIWTLVMFLYSGLLFALLAGAILGWSQWIAKETPWGFWIIPVAAALIIGLHTASWIGQQWSRDQMEDLQQKLKVVLTDLTAQPQPDES